MNVLWIISLVCLDILVLTQVAEGISLQLPEVNQAYRETKQDLIRQRIEVRNKHKKAQAEAEAEKKAEEKAANAKIKPMVAEPGLVEIKPTVRRGHGGAKLLAGQKPNIKSAKLKVPDRPPAAANSHTHDNMHRPQDIYLRRWNVRDKVIL